MKFPIMVIHTQRHAKRCTLSLAYITKLEIAHVLIHREIDNYTLFTNEIQIKKTELKLNVEVHF
jgi:hypothetical protein